MSPRLARKKSLEAIEKNGVMLVFPMDNQKDPPSLWYELYPRSRMEWNWDVDGDDRVVQLWALKTELSTTRDVIYTKWYKNRATYFSRELFSACLRLAKEKEFLYSRESREILDTLRSDSPLSTKQLKEFTQLQGKMLEPLFNKSIRPLWDRFQIVAFGEFEDSSFPSLGIGATETLYEDLYKEAFLMSHEKALSTLNRLMPENSPWRKYWKKIFSN